MVSAALAADPVPQHIDPLGTWLKVDTQLPKEQGGPDSKHNPTKVSLAPYKVKEKDILAIRITGAFSYGKGFPDDGTGTLGAFVGSGSAIIAPDSSMSPGEIGTIATCPRNLGTDVKGDFFLGTNWTFAALPKSAKSLMVGPHDCFWKDNSDPNGDYKVEIQTLKSIISKSITWNLTNDTLTASFVPNAKMTLVDAARLGGYDHFNFISMVIEYTTIGSNGKRVRISLADCAGSAYDLIKNQNGDCPFNKDRKKPLVFFDPIYGGYKYQTDAFGKPFPVRDSLPWYLDEVYANNGSKGPPTQLQQSTEDANLKFSDQPGSGAEFVDEVTFLTALVGVKSNKTGDLLLADGTMYQWKSAGPLSGGVAKTIPSYVKSYLSKNGVSIRDLMK